MRATAKRLAFGESGSTLERHCSNRFWPLTVASLQLIAVLTQPALWLDPAILPFGYAFMQDSGPIR
jgi:hypothetical protein